MLEQFASVISIDDHHKTVSVRINRADSACGGCNQGTACCQNSFFGKREQEKLLTINNNEQLSLNIGDRVRIGIPEDGLLAGALMAYLLPLVGILAGLLLSNYFFDVKDLGQLVGALSGFSLSILILKLWSYRHQEDSQYHVKILEKTS